jgi:hypothetical protein
MSPGAAELLARAQALDLPKNPLDDLIERLGGPGAVAEMTGRKARLLRQENGKYEYVQRSKEAETTADKVGRGGWGVMGALLPCVTRSTCISPHVGTTQGGPPTVLCVDQVNLLPLTLTRSTSWSASCSRRASGASPSSATPPALG